MSTYNNGKPIDVSQIPKSDYETAAREWAEGSKSLENLLLFCLNNNVVTQACCAGTKPDDRDAFLQFELSERNKNSILNLINRYYYLNDVNMTFYNEPEVISKFEIRVPKEKGESLFSDMLHQLSNNLPLEIDSLPEEMRSTMDAMFKHKVPHEYLEVQYAMKDGNKSLFVATNNPIYSDDYWEREDAISWTDEGTGIEGTPEIITPILKNIIRKTGQQYRNYLDRISRSSGYRLPPEGQAER